MSQENPQNIIRSFAAQSNWAGGAVLTDRLVPPAFSRIRTPFVHTWREDSGVVANLDWASTAFSVYLPESLRVVRAIFLKIDVPAIGGGGVFKLYPGLKALKTIRLMSSGQEVYTCDVERFLTDYCESLSEEQLKRFSETYLGKGATATARTLMIPILLPNSQFSLRNGHDNRGYGVWPAFTGHNRLELQLTMGTALSVSAAAANVPGTIKGACSLMYHQVEMSPEDMNRYSDLRGEYSIVNRRFTEITNGYQNYTAAQAAANTVVRWTTSQPQGCVTELMIIAFNDANEELVEDEIIASNVLRPNLIRVIADSITQKELDGKHKIDLELYSHGFVAPADFPSPGRICFAAHCGELSHVYSGGYDMTMASNIVVELRFPSACIWKIIAVQHQRTTIKVDGSVRAFLE